MIKKIEKVFGCCALVIVAVPAALAASPTGWAHQAAGFQSNGAVTVKSLAGGSYSSTQNPTGAVAKVNQSAATQAPTVIIQATGSAYAETYPMMAVSPGTVPATPSCPAGYTATWSKSGTGQSANGWGWYNVAGSRWSLVGISPNGAPYMAWMPDSQWNWNYNGTNTNIPMQGPIGYVPSSYNWIAVLCMK